MTQTSVGRLRGDDCGVDWIWDREAETMSAEASFAQSAAAWDQQFERIAKQSPFYARKFREAGIGHSHVRLTDIAKLPFTTKTEQREAIDERPPFGTNVCVPPDLVKRIYQTSGTTGAPPRMRFRSGPRR